MTIARWIAAPILLVGSLWWAGSTGGQGTPGKFVPKLEAIAETKLIMEGIAHTNYRGLERILNQKPPEERCEYPPGRRGPRYQRSEHQALIDLNLNSVRPSRN